VAQNGSPSTEKGADELIVGLKSAFPEMIQTFSSLVGGNSPLPSSPSAFAHATAGEWKQYGPREFIACLIRMTRYAGFARVISWS
jgi:hypothetical protein